MSEPIELGSRVRRLFGAAWGEVVALGDDGVAEIEWPDGATSTTPVRGVRLIDDDDRLIDPAPVSVGAYVRRIYGGVLGRVTAVHDRIVDVDWTDQIAIAGACEVVAEAVP
jgi:hypothetical protein